MLSCIFFVSSSSSHTYRLTDAPGEEPLDISVLKEAIFSGTFFAISLSSDTGPLTDVPSEPDEDSSDFGDLLVDMWL